ncbi:hypothetical protein ACFZDG_03835 [Kitasatospora xanthocidica]|uniref:hypothetical protein n=1 Tax=Kitasatospora xanthocidica TaxID=83382 RepID=UPI0036F11C19
MTRSRHRPALDVRVEIRRPPARRRIARHKAVVLARRTPGQAAREPLAPDRRFHVIEPVSGGRIGAGTLSTPN